MVVVLAVVAGDLAGGVELAEQLGAQDGLHLGHGGPGVQAVGEQQQHVLLLHPGGVQLVQAGTDGLLPVAGGLVAPLDDVRMTMTTDLPGPASSFSGGMPMGLRMDARVAAYRLSQSWGRQGIRYRLPGMKMSVLSGSSAPSRPCPYSNSSFIGCIPP